jgi:hypothetical protein
MRFIDRGNDAKCGARQGLAIAAVTNPDTFRIDLGFKPDLSAVAGAVNFHARFLHARLSPRHH